MVRLSNALLLLVLLLWTAGAHGARSAQDVRLHNGMGSGQDYLRMPETERPAYVMGLVNGLFVSPLFGINEAARLFGVEVLHQGHRAFDVGKEGSNGFTLLL